MLDVRSMVVLMSLLRVDYPDGHRLSCMVRVVGKQVVGSIIPLPCAKEHDSDHILGDVSQLEVALRDFTYCFR